MNADSARKWHETREKGRARYVFVTAVLWWVGIGIGNTISELLDDDWAGLQSLWMGERFLVRLAVGAPIAYLLARWWWSRTERAYAAFSQSTDAEA